MLTDSLAYRTARGHVHAFKSESDEILARTIVAQPCAVSDPTTQTDCESYLQLGIDACRWLRRANDHFHKAVSQGLIKPSADLDESIEVLFRLWLPPVDTANSLIDDQIKRGSTPANLAEFRECERSVRDEVERIDRLKALEERVPAVDDLKLIAIDSREWLSEPGCPS
jgi:hypothetical protein